MDIESARFNPFFGKIETRANAVAVTKLFFPLMIIAPMFSVAEFILKVTRTGIVVQMLDLVLGVLSFIIVLGYFWFKRSFSTGAAVITASAGFSFYLLQAIKQFMTGNETFQSALIGLFVGVFFGTHCIRFIQAAKILRDK